MGQINRIPLGFLDLIGAQSQGQTPPLYSDSVAPVVDMNELYLAQTLSGATSGLVHGNAGAVVDFDIPDGETWLLRACSVQEVMPATTNITQIEFRLALVPRSAGGTATVKLQQIYVTPQLTVPNVNQFAADAFYLSHPLALSTGARVRATVVARDVSANRTASVSLTFNRLKN